MNASYDTIGLNYAELRHADARIAKLIQTALGDSNTVLNVGAGAGSYEPEDRAITALEPSAEMIAQRPVSNAKVVQGSAENLPFEDECFDAVMAVLTVHHWNDKAKGMAEMRRVSRGPIVILTYDPAFRDFWLFHYFPELVALDEGQMPPMDEYLNWLGDVEVSPVLIPHDCSDGFLAAYWRRPAAYLDTAFVLRFLHSGRLAISHPVWIDLGMISKAALGKSSLGTFLHSMSETVDIGWWSRRDLFDTVAKAVIRSASVNGRFVPHSVSSDQRELCICGEWPVW